MPQGGRGYPQQRPGQAGGTTVVVQGGGGGGRDGFAEGWAQFYYNSTVLIDWDWYFTLSVPDCSVKRICEDRIYIQKENNLPLPYQSIGDKAQV